MCMYCKYWSFSISVNTLIIYKKDILSLLFDIIVIMIVKGIWWSGPGNVAGWFNMRIAFENGNGFIAHDSDIQN